MKKACITLLLVVSLILVACQTVYVCPNGEKVGDARLCEVEEPKVEKVAPKPVKKVPEPVEEKIPTWLQNLLAKHSSVRSLSYDYKEVHNPLNPVIAVKIRGPVVLQEVPYSSKFLHRAEYDVIRFDVSKKSAVAYCEDFDNCKDVGEFGDVAFHDHYLKTPFDWLEEIDTAQKINEGVKDGRKTWRLLVNGDIKMDVDAHYGIPLRVDDGARVYEYRRPLFNQLSSADLEIS